jgi:lipopolysaccharide transport system permease protein
MRTVISNATALWVVNWQHRDLIRRMIRREIAGRYLGSVLGIAWAVIQPLIMLCVFTFAFNVIFRSRWVGAAVGEPETNFAVAMFIGFIVFTLVSEPLNRAPSLVVGHVNYVKKVVFPLEILATVVVGTALFQFGMGFMAWLGLLLLVHHSVPWTIVFLPLVLFPVVLMTAGLVWLLASLGVYVRDLGQIIAPATLCLMFLSPVFYPASAVPLPFRSWIFANPLTGIIEEARKVAIFGEMPDGALLAGNLILGLTVAHLGYLWFTRTRRGFADVL